MWANPGRQSKARLAAIHSGCFYWHIRRFSRMSFYEPLSIFYATLTLWAYGFYSLSRPHENDSKDNRSNTTTGVDDEASDNSCYWQPTFIYLDRPTTTRWCNYLCAQAGLQPLSLAWEIYVDTMGRSGCYERGYACGGYACGRFSLDAGAEPTNIWIFW